MNLETSEAQFDELEKEIKIENTGLKENKMNTNDNNEYLHVIETPEVTMYIQCCISSRRRKCK